VKLLDIPLPLVIFGVSVYPESNFPLWIFLT
jgi:hypothetical protein